MGEMGTAYRDTRARVSELIGSTGAEELESFAPATPEWRVRDVLAHLTGVSSDLVNGNLVGVGTDPWTQQQVDARRERSLDELLAEWDECGGAVDALVDDFGPAGGQLIFDTVTHEHDIRHALGRTGARDSDALRVAFEWSSSTVVFLDRPLYIETELGTVAYSVGDATSSARTTAFELLRAATGRRSADEIAAWDWDGEPLTDLVVAGPPFTIRSSPLGE